MKNDKNKQGFTLLEIMIVVSIIGLLAVIALPAFMAARTKSQTSVCISGLRQISSAKEQWSLTSFKKNGYVILPADRIGPDGVDSFIKGGAPTCPAGGTYDYKSIGTNPVCSVTGHVLPY